MEKQGLTSTYCSYSLYRLEYEVDLAQGSHGHNYRISFIVTFSHDALEVYNVWLGCGSNSVTCLQLVLVIICRAWQETARSLIP